MERFRTNRNRVVGSRQAPPVLAVRVVEPPPLPARGDGHAEAGPSRFTRGSPPVEFPSNQSPPRRSSTRLPALVLSSMSGAGVLERGSNSGGCSPS